MFMVNTFRFLMVNNALKINDKKHLPAGSIDLTLRGASHIKEGR